MATNLMGGWRATAIAWAGVAACVLAISCGVLPSDPTLPVYTSEQTDSAHAGHRRTTVTGGGAVYVSDLEEELLIMRSSEPKDVVGRSQWGDGKICAIEGQDRSAYLAVDVGSEMPAYEVFRNTNHPPFDWRRAAFQKMRLDMLEGPAANKETEDPALIEDVVRALRDGTPVSPPLPPLTVGANGMPPGVHGILLFSDQLPGRTFRPWFYIDPSGQVFLTQDFVMTYGQNPSARGDWIPASQSFTRWAQTAP